MSRSISTTVVRLVSPLVLSGLLLFQAYVYYARLTLSLGPLVILQPWLLRQGYLTYENIALPYTPLMPILLSMLIPFFSDGLALAKTVLVALITISALLTALAARRCAGWIGGLGAAFLFVAWSPIFWFTKLWHETFLTAICALLLLYDSTSSSPRSATFRLALGFLCGIAILVKQHAIFMVFAVLLWCAWRNWSAFRSLSMVFKDSALLGFAAVLPLIVFAASHYFAAGTLKNFFYWTLQWNLESNFVTLGALSPTSEQLSLLLPTYLFLPLAIFIMFDLRRKGNTLWLQFAWVFLLLVTSSVTAFPRFAPFHFQASLPALAWLSALTLSYSVGAIAPNLEFNPKLFALGITSALVIFWLIRTISAYQSVFQTDQPRRIAEYSDLVPLTQQVREQIGATSCFYIFPDDEALANLYYLARCPPPKFWVFHYPWNLLDKIQNQILLTLDDQQPEWIVYAPGHWGVEERAPKIIGYIQQHYQLAVTLAWAQGQIQLLKRVE